MADGLSAASGGTHPRSSRCLPNRRNDGTAVCRGSSGAGPRPVSEGRAVERSPADVVVGQRQKTGNAGTPRRALTTRGDGDFDRLTSVRRTIRARLVPDRNRRRPERRRRLSAIRAAAPRKRSAEDGKRGRARRTETPPRSGESESAGPVKRPGRGEIEERRDGYSVRDNGRPPGLRARTIGGESGRTVTRPKRPGDSIASPAPSRRREALACTRGPLAEDLFEPWRRPSILLEEGPAFQSAGSGNHYRRTSALFGTRGQA